MINYHFFGKEFNSNLSKVEDFLKENYQSNIKLCYLKQIHSNIVIEATPNQIFEGDALISNQKNIALLIVTADCAPILIYDKTNNNIAAIHAGWRGAKAKIIDNSIKNLIKLGSNPCNLKAIIGPMIGQKNYEIDQNFYQDFLTEDKNNQKFFQKNRENHYLFDLKSYIKSQLNFLKITDIIDVNIDTFANNNFYSYRRASQNNQPQKMRNFSLMVRKNYKHLKQELTVSKDKAATSLDKD